MVTAAFTIFFGLELLFIRILAIAGQHRGPQASETLTFCASHNTLTCIAQRRFGWMEGVK
jgi:hypothetical protein